MKLNRATNRLSPHANNGRATETNPEVCNTHDRSENRSGSGNKLHDVWEATQRTVRLFKPGSGNGRSSEELESGAEVKTESSTGAGTSSGRGVNMERKGQFQLVMSELKTRARTKNAARNVQEYDCKKQDASPTSVQNNVIRDTPEEDALSSANAVHNYGGRTSLSSDEEESRSGRNWITRTPVFEMVASRSKRRNARSRSTQWRKPPFTSISPSGGVIPLSKGRGKSLDMPTQECDSTQNGRRALRPGLDPASLQRIIGRGILPFKRRHVYERSESLTNEIFQAGNVLDELGGDHGTHLRLQDLSPEDLGTKVQKLLTAIELSEKKLVKLQMEAEKNRLELRLEVCRLQNVVTSFSKTQELRYRTLLEGLEENYRAIGQVQSSFDHYFSLVNHEKRAKFHHRVRSFFFFALDSFLGSLLSFTHAATELYCRYRLKYEHKASRAPV